MAAPLFHQDVPTLKKDGWWDHVLELQHHTLQNHSRVARYDCTSEGLQELHDSYVWNELSMDIKTVEKQRQLEIIAYIDRLKADDVPEAEVVMIHDLAQHALADWVSSRHAILARVEADQVNRRLQREAVQTGTA